MMIELHRVKQELTGQSMRMSQEEKERSHERVIASAARLMRERGVEGAAVSDVMQDAGMTHGGFYKHFESKEALLEAALDQAFDEIAGMLRPDAAAGEATSIRSAFQEYYLSEGHVASPGVGCPVAALAGDIARTAAGVRARFGFGVRKVASLLARGLSGSGRARNARALRQLAMMAGAVMIARASDPGTAQEVLAACREKSA